MPENQSPIVFPCRTTENGLFCANENRAFIGAPLFLPPRKADWQNPRAPTLALVATLKNHTPSLKKTHGFVHRSFLQTTVELLPSFQNRNAVSRPRLTASSEKFPDIRFYFCKCASQDALRARLNLSFCELFHLHFGKYEENHAARTEKSFSIH